MQEERVRRSRSKTRRTSRHHTELFDEVLKGWYTDPALWPRDRSLKMLQEVVFLRVHSVVVDTGESRLQDDEFED